MSKPRVAVAAPNALASQAGEAMARAGGNAVDVAIAAMVVACVSEPGICSLGGGGYATVAQPGQAPVTFDGYVAMPGVGRDGPFDLGSDLYTEYGGGVTITIGHGSIATPGTPQMLVALHAEAGHASWEDVLAPALDVATRGFPLGTASDFYLDYIHNDLYGWHAPSHAALHHTDGSRLMKGEICRPAYLDQTIAEWQADPATFSHGLLAELIVADVEAAGAALGHADLRAYVPTVRTPLSVELGDWTFWTNPPPAVGGPVVAMLLAGLRTPPGPDGWSAADRARTVDVLRAVLGHRVDVLDVAEDREGAGWDAVTRLVQGGLAGLTAPSTCHVSAIDRDGLAVAITCSAGYGSGVMPPGTGVWMNNCLGEKELTRRGPEGYTPGDRLPSNMAPTVGRAIDGRVLAAGSPGADRITPSMMHALAGYAGGMGLQDAIDAPRIHLTRWPDGAERLDIEEDVQLDLAVAPELPRRMFAPHSMYYGGVAITVAHADGTLEAAADPRRDGGTAIV
jgi:gamma-glutamyltranspeptidase/glutathione hydrolase